MSPHHPHLPRPDSEPDDLTYEEEETVTTRVTDVRISMPARKSKDRGTLTVTAGPDTGRVYSLGPDVTIGRGRQCEIPLDDSSVSRAHSRIQLSPDGSRWISDLQSRNGTFVEGFRIERHQLREGDQIQLGPAVQFRYAVTDDEEERRLRDLYESSVRDPLTGTFNRKHFAERLAAEISFAIRHGTDLSLLLFDVDHFKRVNDTWGHLAGDKVLKSIGASVARTIRTEDILARYGGEEFIVIARNIGALGAMALAERIRNVIQSSLIEFDGTPIRITVSIGVATSRCCEGKVTAEGLVGIADRRLYAAKDAGRNRVVGPDK